MISTITMNPCIDKTVTIEEFQYGELNRIKDSRIDPSGKGINVGIALQQLGTNVSCLGINYENKGDLITDYLKELDVAYDFTRAQGTVRTNLKVVDLKNKVTTEINESGEEIEDKVLSNLKSKIKKYATRSELMVFSGSVPEGVSPSIYRILLEELKDNSVRTILDAENELLLQGIEANPYLIKPNLYELENTFNKKLTTRVEIAKTASQIVKNRGIKVVCVSLGGDGALIVDKNKAYFAPALSIPVKGVIGAGDSLVAGMCLGILKNLSLKEILKRGMAAAAASIIRKGTLLCTREDFDNFLNKVKIEELTDF